MSMVLMVPENKQLQQLNHTGQQTNKSTNSHILRMDQ